MHFDALISKLHDQAWFDLPTVALLFSHEEARSVRTSLHRFMQEGKLTGLRRGLYCFGPRYRKQAIHGPLVANLCYQPSYLSERWALSWYGVIPEKTVVYTSVSPRPTRRFSNEWGEFQYRTIKRSFRNGFIEMNIQEVGVRISEPEQALLDLWYLEGGEWTEARMESMRFDPEGVRTGRLSVLAAEFPCGRPGDRDRLSRSVQAWNRYSETCARRGIRI